ncbi:hypothetical protein QYF36_025111 [Acer negundo]|nr:hypothetical protein QYF36_025111 [Acer negundo]
MTGGSCSGNHLDGDESEMQAFRASTTVFEKKVDEGNQGRRQNPHPIHNPPPPQNTRRIHNHSQPHFESEDDAGHRRPPPLNADSRSNEEAEDWAFGANSDSNIEKGKVVQQPQASSTKHSTNNNTSNFNKAPGKFPSIQSR